MVGPVLIPGIDPDEYYERLGPLKEPLLDDRVSEVMVSGKDNVYVEMDGRIVKTRLEFPDEDSLVQVIQHIAETVGRRVTEASPLVDCRLIDGSRVNAVLRPIAIDGPGHPRVTLLRADRSTYDAGGTAAVTIDDGSHGAGTIALRLGDGIPAQGADFADALAPVVAELAGR